MNQSKSDSIRPQDMEIKRYWLGQLSHVDEEQLEKDYFADRELSEQVTIVKDELIDEYIFGHLPQYDRFCFESNFLNIPEHRQQVELISSLVGTLGKTPHPISSPTTDTTPHPKAETVSFWKFWTGLPTSVRGFAWASAPLLVLTVLGGAWLFQENYQMRQELTQLRADQQQREEEWQKRLAALRTQGSPTVTPSPLPSISPHSQPSATPKILPSPETESSSAPVLATLLPNVSGRGANNIEKVAITPAVLHFKLKLLLENPTAYRSYQAQVKSDRGQIIPRKTGLHPSASGSIEIEFSSSLFTAGNYSLTLFGTDGQKAPAIAADYSFRVVKE